jgi:hypothetical protein
VLSLVLQNFHHIERSPSGGAATAVAVSLNPTPGSGRWVVDGAAVGDACAILIHSNSWHATQLNSVKRRDNNPMDTGGQIECCACAAVSPQDLSEFTVGLGEGDMLLLATDGLTDNVFDLGKGKSSLVVPFVVSLPFFDNAVTSLSNSIKSLQPVMSPCQVTSLCPWSNLCAQCSPRSARSIASVGDVTLSSTEKINVGDGKVKENKEKAVPPTPSTLDLKLCECFGEPVEGAPPQDPAIRPRLPTIGDLESMFFGSHHDEIGDIPPKQAVARLNHYVAWVVGTMKHHQQVLFERCLRNEEEVRKIIQQSGNDSSQMQTVQAMVERMQSEVVKVNKKMSGWYVGKTDDLLMIAINPRWGEKQGNPSDRVVLYSATPRGEVVPGPKNLNSHNVDPATGCCC